MKRAIYVDYENVSLHGLEAVEKLGSDDIVKIFIGTQSTRLSMEDANRIFNCEASVELITNKYIGKNALDFIIMVYMGYDIAKGLAEAYFVVSNDKGYDPAIYQMRKLSGLKVQRKSDISFVLRERIIENNKPGEMVLPVPNVTETSKKESVGRRFLSLFGFGKDKTESEDETEDIKEVAGTESIIVGKKAENSAVMEKIISELVDEEKERKSHVRKNNSNRRYNNSNRSNNRSEHSNNWKNDATPGTVSKAKKQQEKPRKAEEQKELKPLAQKETKPLAQKKTKPAAQKKAKPVVQKETKPAAQKETTPVVQKGTKNEKQKKTQNVRNRKTSKEKEQKTQNETQKKNETETQNKPQNQPGKKPQNEPLKKSENEPQKDNRKETGKESRKGFQKNAQKGNKNEPQKALQNDNTSGIMKELQKEVQKDKPTEITGEPQKDFQQDNQKETKKPDNSSQSSGEKSGGKNVTCSRRGRGRQKPVSKTEKNEAKIEKTEVKNQNPEVKNAPPEVKNEKPVEPASGELSERERERNEAFALLAALDEEESRETKVKYKRK